MSNNQIFFLQDIYKLNKINFWNKFLAIKFLYLTVLAYLCFLTLIFLSILPSSLIRGHWQMMKTMYLLESRYKMPNANISQLFLLGPGVRVLVTSLVLHNKKLSFINNIYTLGSPICKRDGSMGCYIAKDKPYITPKKFYFILNSWRTRLFTDNSIAAPDFTNGFFLRFFLSLAFWGLLAHSLGSLDAWGWVVQQYLQTMQWWNSLRAESYNIKHEHENEHIKRVHKKSTYKERIQKAHKKSA